MKPFLVNSKVIVKGNNFLFIGVIEKVEWDLNQWSYLINGNWYCQSDVYPE